MNGNTIESRVFSTRYKVVHKKHIKFGIIMKNMDCYHIAFCVNDTYARYITVTIKSIAENCKSPNGGGVYIHVITDGISEINLQYLEQVVSEYKNILLKIYVVDDSSLQNLKITHSWPIQAWYRILLPDILPAEVSRVLYLDADTLVVSNIKELFAINMVDRSIAATLDVQSVFDEPYIRCCYESVKQYICSGVLLMNLEYWRANRLTETIIKWAQHNSDRLKCPDQDAINYVCRTSKIVLPLRYGILQWFFTNENFYQEPYIEQLRDCVTNPAIIHYASSVPWYYDTPKHIMYKQWFRYNKMLKSPIKCTYRTNGFVLIKMICWNLLHPFSKKSKQLNLKGVKSRLFNV